MTRISSSLLDNKNSEIQYITNFKSNKDESPLVQLSHKEIIGQINQYLHKRLVPIHNYNMNRAQN